LFTHVYLPFVIIFSTTDGLLLLKAVSLAAYLIFNDTIAGDTAVQKAINTGLKSDLKIPWLIIVAR
jgi:hypothetical protein